MDTIREQALAILLKSFPDAPNQKIYECAQEWSEKQVTTAGLVKYFEAYYTGPK